MKFSQNVDIKRPIASVQWNSGSPPHTVKRMWGNKCSFFMAHFKHYPIYLLNMLNININKKLSSQSSNNLWWSENSPWNSLLGKKWNKIDNIQIFWKHRKFDTKITKEMKILDFSIFVKKIFPNNVVLWCSMIITLFLAGLPPPPCYKMLCFSWPPPPLGGIT